MIKVSTVVHRGHAANKKLSTVSKRLRTMIFVSDDPKIATFLSHANLVRCCISYTCP